MKCRLKPEVLHVEGSPEIYLEKGLKGVGSGFYQEGLMKNIW